LTLPVNRNITGRERILLASCFQSSLSRFSEDLVGQALLELQTKHNIPRKDLFIQTKFTSLDGQDRSKPLPYDPRVPLNEQVRQSVATSLENLKTGYLDSLVLHGPESTHQKTMEVYRECEKFVDEGRVKQLGISNLYNLNGLRKLYDDARHKPAVVQNRFHAETKFDSDIRQFCREKNIFYQSFWTLTGTSTPIESDRDVFSLF
jgi:diketogulonate reductase-like aldo/keto reductase